MGLGKRVRATYEKALRSLPHIIYTIFTKLLYSSKYFRAETFQEKSWAMAWSMMRVHSSLLA